MKQLINKIDQQLLEKYPLLWNLKLVWITAAALILHLFFFLMGIATVSNPTSLHTSNVYETYFSYGWLFIGMILSLILIVLWLIQLFKNNAFKHFYPTKARDLFLQLLAVFFITFISVNFYWSYGWGMQAYALLKYDDDTVASLKETVAKGGIFMTHNLYDYEVDNACYPKPLDSLYRRENGVNTVKPHLSYKNRRYQFFNYQTFETSKQDSYAYKQNNRNGEIIIDEEYLENDKILFYLVDSVVDVSAYIKTEKPSLYHYSDYYLQKDLYDYSESFIDIKSANYNPQNFSFFTTEEVAQAKWLHEFLNTSSTQEVEEFLEEFIKVANDLEIRHNLTASSWMDVFDPSTNYEIKELIHKGVEPYEESYIDFNNANITAFEKHAREITKDKFFHSNALQYSIRNIDDLRSTNIVEETVHFFLWLSLGFSLLIWLFRITSIKSLLLSIVAAGIIAVLSGFLILIVSEIVPFAEEYPTLFTAIAINLFFVVMAWLKPWKGSKLVNSIFLNLGIVAILPFLLFTKLFINEILKDRCDYETLDYYECTQLYGINSDYTSWAIFILFLILIALLCKRVIAWRASPEG